MDFVRDYVSPLCRSLAAQEQQVKLHRVKCRALLERVLMVESAMNKLFTANPAAAQSEHTRNLLSVLLSSLHKASFLFKDLSSPDWQSSLDKFATCTKERFDEINADIADFGQQLQLPISRDPEAEQQQAWLSHAQDMEVLLQMVQQPDADARLLSLQPVISSELQSSRAKAQQEVHQKHAADGHGTGMQEVLPSSIQPRPSDTQAIQRCLLGAGGFGEVYKAQWKAVTVAVKKLLMQTMTPEGLDMFRKEASLMAQLHHPSVLHVFGVSTVPNEMCIVMEFCEKGSLFDALHKRAEPMSWARRLEVLLQTASGMFYLHTRSPPVLHRDLKSLNLLLDKAGDVKITDFGMAKVRTDTQAATTGQAGGTILWMAPESLNGSTPYSSACDVFSFAMVMYEVSEQKLPWAGMATNAIVVNLTAGGRPQISQQLLAAHPEFAALMQACWQQDPSKRPAFPEIVEQLQAMLEKEKRQTQSGSFSLLQSRLGPNLLGCANLAGVVEKNNINTRPNPYPNPPVVQREVPVMAGPAPPPCGASYTPYPCAIPIPFVPPRPASISRGPPTHPSGPYPGPGYLPHEGYPNPTPTGRNSFPRPDGRGVICGPTIAGPGPAGRNSSLYGPAGDVVDQSNKPLLSGSNDQPGQPGHSRPGSMDMLPPPRHERDWREMFAGNKKWYCSGGAVAAVIILIIIIVAAASSGDSCHTCPSNCFELACTTQYGVHYPCDCGTFCQPFTC